MLAKMSSASVLGVSGQRVTVEVHVSNGLPGFTIVGLPDTACREARDRVRAAVLSSGCKWPQRRVTVNLAPSGIRKVGSGLDLAIALATLRADEQLPSFADDWAALGELGLDGSVRPVPGMIPALVALANNRVVLPSRCGVDDETMGVRELRVVSTLREVVDAFNGEPWPNPPPAEPVADRPPEPDLADLRGQPFARLALEVAAAGGHHLLLVGPPGAGKTMLARRLPGVLPPLSPSCALQVMSIESAAGATGTSSAMPVRPPFRAPHHSATMVAMVGGGAPSLRPGEVTRAAHGVLFLDELGEFAPHVLDALRQPLEEGVVRVARAHASVVMPAQFLLVAAMNPCPCGEGGRPGACRCSDRERLRYRRRLSGPLLDRFDLRVDVARPDTADLLRGHGGECSATVAARVAEARGRATQRGVACNAQLDAGALDRHTPLESGAAALLEAALRSGTLSARGLVRVRRVALTIADLTGHHGRLSADHLGLALQLRADPRMLDGLGA